MTAPDGAILVTGASGFVGSHLLPALRSAYPAARVVGTGRRGDPALDLVPLSMEDEGGVRALVGALRPRAIVHLAALSSVDLALAEPNAAWGVNLRGTLHLAQAALDLSPEASFVLASSGDVYGVSLGAGRPLDEAAVLRPANPYAAAKAAADLALGEMALRGLRAVRLRLFNHTGPGQSAGFVLPNLARQVAAVAARRQPPVIATGDLDRWRDFLDVEDVVRAYLAVLAWPVPFGGEVFNVASGRPRHLGRALLELMGLAGVAAERVELSARARPYDPIYSAGDPALFERTFGWAPRVGWLATLERLLDHWSARARSPDR